MAQAEHLDYNTIGQRVPVSYRGVAEAKVASDDASTRPAGYNTALFTALEQTNLDGILFGASKIGFRDITDGTSIFLLYDRYKGILSTSIRLRDEGGQTW